jgi:hypothetical protein
MKLILVMFLPFMLGISVVLESTGIKSGIVRTESEVR